MSFKVSGLQGHSQFVMVSLAVALIAMALPTSNPVSAKKPKVIGADVYKQYCNSCHLGGGNSITPGKPIAESEKVAHFGIFKEYLQSPEGHMPYFKELIDDTATLKALYRYCKSLKKSQVKEITFKPAAETGNNHG